MISVFFCIQVHLGSYIRNFKIGINGTECNSMKEPLTTKAFFACNKIGESVQIQLSNPYRLSLCSVKVYGGKLTLSKNSKEKLNKVH